MIAWCLEEKKAYLVLIEEGRTVFSCLDHDLYFLKSAGEIYLRLPHEIIYESRSRITHESTVSIRNQETGRHCVICFSSYDEGYGRFERYQTKPVITIGSSIEDDIYLQDHHLKEAQVRIDFKAGIIEERSTYPMSMLNDHYLRKEAFQNGDVLRIMNLQILLHHDFLVINQVGNLYHSLTPYVPTKECIPLPQRPEIPVIRKYRSPVLSRTILLDLEEPVKIEKRRRQPLIFLMGPAMTMSGATMTAGLLSAYDGYLNGRSVEEMLPMILLPCMMMISTLLWNPLQRRYDKKIDLKERKERILSYTIYLDHLQKQIEETEINYFHTIQKEIPFLLPETFEKQNVYQKLPTHNDWLMINLGEGTVLFFYQIARTFHLSESDPLQKMTMDALQASSKHHGDVIFSLMSSRITAVSGDQREELVEYMLAQLLISHGPDVLRVIFACSMEWMHQHAWIRRVPHSVSNDGTRLIVQSQSDVCEMKAVLETDTFQSALLITTRPYLMQDIKDERIHAVILCDECIPPEAEARISIQNGHGELETKTEHQSFHCQIPISFHIENIIEKLNQYDLPGQKIIMSSNGFLALHDVETSDALKIVNHWKINRCRSGIKCVLGISANQEKVILDLHENGQGPHGLIAGTTGSGKSELIISMILSLVIQYSPRELQFVLIDFKGGGAAQVFSNSTYTLPHIAGVLSNLDVAEMERALVSFTQECHRREVLFQKMSRSASLPVMNLGTYQSLWQEEYGLPYIAELVIIVDEFAELKKDKPDFMRDLISIARVGRSLGIHLILSTQKPAGVIDDQIWSNSRFKICLKVQDRQDSMEILHDPSASLIRQPGEFYLLCDGMMMHARSGYAGALEGKEPSSIEVLDWMNHVSKRIQEKKENQITQSHAVIQEIKAADASFHERADVLWLPPIKEAILNDSAGPYVYLGLLDDYYHRKYEWLIYDPEKFQHMCVFSIQRDEKTAFLRTILKELLKRDDRKMEIYLIDDLSFPCHLISESPYICSCFSSDNHEKIKNLVSYFKSRDHDEEGRCFIIIDDLASFYAADEENKNLLHHCLETSAGHKAHFILMMNTASVIPCRDLTLIPFRLSLANENEQDLSQIFEKPVRKKVQKGHGMYFKEHILDLKLLETSMEQLISASEDTIRLLGRKKNHVLPEIPAIISLKDYRGKGLGLGIDLQTYEWVDTARNQTLIILATYEEELYEMENFWRKQNCVMLISPDDKQIQQILEQNELVLIFMTLDEFRNSLLRMHSRRLPILYIGRGFRDQYDFSISTWKGEMKKNYGVFFQAGRKQVIQIAESNE